jgi:hypothetical protein
VSTSAGADEARDTATVQQDYLTFSCLDSPSLVANTSHNNLDRIFGAASVEQAGPERRPVDAYGHRTGLPISEGVGDKKGVAGS